MFVYIILFFASLLSADNFQASFTGTVFRVEEQIPLSGANVILTHKQGESFGISTDKSGLFNIQNLPSGNYTLLISYIGFNDYRDNIKVESGKAYNVDIGLDIKPILMTKLEIISDASTPYKNLPGSASVMDAQTIKLLNPIGTQEMLEYVPGINGFADDGIGNSRISIGIRGLNPRRSSRVLILEDGIPIQPALYVYPNMYYNPPADRIDRLEVIKGSGSIMYGPQTMGGVVNYFTRRPRQLFGGLLRLTSGENGYNSLFAEVGGWGNGKLNPELQLLYKTGDGFRENNGFEQYNGTFKVNFNRSSTDNIYLKVNLDYENSNATYTGLTQWSYDNNSKFNPKEHDNFKVFRTAVDLIRSQELSSKIRKTSKFFTSYFDRRWWRENDIFISASDINEESPSAQPYYNSGDLVRTGNGEDSFGILRTFYVAGLEQSYSMDHYLFGMASKLNVGGRVYWERFIDDKQTGLASDSRDGFYFFPALNEDEIDTIVGQSHHYETMAFSGFISESFDIGSINLRPGLRFEFFEQERIDRLAGATYLDKTTYVILPGIGFINNFYGVSLFGGIHRGFTPPSSGALKILNFGENPNGGGLDLKAEKSWNKELGLRGDLSLIKYEISGFHVGIENLVAAGRGTAFKNLGKVQTYGLELQTSLMFSKVKTAIASMSFLLPDLNISYTFLQTEVLNGNILSNVSGTVGSEVSISGKELPYAPENTLIVGLEKSLFRNINIKVDFKYISDSFTDFENIEKFDNKGIQGPIPAHHVINLSSDYQFGDFRLFFSAKNLMDEKYIGSRLHSNPGQPEAGLSSGIMPGPRRQINLGVDYVF